MREIKFRAWDHQNNSMFYPHEIYFDEGLKNIRALDTMANYIENGRPRFMLMQYTGLRDRNGREIYEGDIVEQQSEWDRITVRGEIVFSRGIFVVRDCGCQEHLLNETAEVIGNIYENTELLKEGD